MEWLVCGQGWWVHVPSDPQRVYRGDCCSPIALASELKLAQGGLSVRRKPERQSLF